MARARTGGWLAEGVEGAEQRDALVRLGCPHGQGYFWRPPLDASSFDELVDARLL